MACTKEDKLKITGQGLTIILDDLDLTWKDELIQEAADLWQQGKDIWEIAAKVKPYDQEQNALDEVTLLIIHMKRQGIIMNRQRGIYGSCAV